MIESDTPLLLGQHFSIGRETDVELTVKRSRFIGSVRFLKEESLLHDILKEIEGLYPQASTYAWAYRLFHPVVREYFSDGGEPAGTAGKPILGAIKKREIYDVLVVVTRYYGGIKLGVRGLIEAFGEAANRALDEAGLTVVEETCLLDVTLSYEAFNQLESLLKKKGLDFQKGEIRFGERVELQLAIPKRLKQEIEAFLAEGMGKGRLSYCWGDPKTF